MRPLEILKSKVERSMALMGTSSIGEINRSHVRTVGVQGDGSGLDRPA